MRKYCKRMTKKGLADCTDIPPIPEEWKSKIEHGPVMPFEGQPSIMRIKPMPLYPARPTIFMSDAEWVDYQCRLIRNQTRRRN